MSKAGEFTIALRFFGDDLDPEKISSRLGVTPTYGCRKGDRIRVKTRDRIATTGKWLLKIPAKSEDSLDLVIGILLDGMTKDLHVWRKLANAYDGDLYCGVSLDGASKGMELSPRLTRRLAERGLQLGLDIYAVRNEDDG